MRALHLLTLGAAMVVPAAAANAQFGVYVGPAHRYVVPAPVYGYGPAYAPGYAVAVGPAYGGYWAYGPSGRYWVARHMWNDHREWHRGWGHDRRW
jgi:hypothetical protein